MKPLWYLACAALLLVACHVEADTRTKAILLDEDLIAAFDMNKAVVSTPAGKIHFPDRLFAQDLSAQLENDPFVKQYKKIYSFFAIDFTISIEPSVHFTPERVRIAGSLPGGEAMERKVLVRDVFPRSKFTSPNASVEGSVEISAGATFGPPLLGAVTPVLGGKGGLQLAFKYAPVFAELTAGFGGSTFFWEFTRTQAVIPTGAIPLKMILMLPRGVPPPRVTLDVIVDFSKRWWEPNQEGLASHRVAVQLPGS